MSANYDEYLHDHVKNVGIAYNKLCELMPDIRNKVGDPFFINNHDLSKWNDEEYGAYDRYFYGGNRSAAVVKEFNYAWLTHIHNNPHHWQYWVLINDDDGKNNPLEMPYNYIVEMICDWWSFSWKAGKPESILDWYEDHRPLMELHPSTRKIVEDILKRIRKEYVKEEEDDKLYLEHHGIKGQKWGVKHGPPYPLDDEVASKVRMKGKWDDGNSIDEYKENTAKSIASHGTEKLDELSRIPEGEKVDEYFSQINRSGGDGTDEGRHFNCQNCAVAFEMVNRGYDVKARPKKTGENVGDIEKFFEGGKLERTFKETDMSKWIADKKMVDEYQEMFDEENKRIDSKKSTMQKLKERITGNVDDSRYYKVDEDTMKTIRTETARQESLKNLRSSLESQGEGARGIIVEGFINDYDMQEGKRATAFHALNYRVEKDGTIKMFDTQSHRTYKNTGEEVRDYDGYVVFPGFSDNLDPRELYFMRTDNLKATEAVTGAVYSRKGGK